jgi:hypothetical protein
MLIVGLASGKPSPWDGRYLKAFDPNERGRDPEGRETLALVELTDDVSEAMRFDDAGDAMRTWKRPSWRWPDEGRLDLERGGANVGAPARNRPLTAFTVEVQRLPEEE